MDRTSRCNRTRCLIRARSRPGGSSRNFPHRQCSGAYDATMRVLIAGCGYVGISLGAELARLGHQVSGLRRTDCADPLLIAAGITPLHGDVTRPLELTRLPSRYDWVVNCVTSS